MKKALQDEPTNGQGCVTVEPGLDHARMHDLISSPWRLQQLWLHMNRLMYTRSWLSLCACNQHVEDALTGGVSCGWRGAQ